MSYPIGYCLPKKWRSLISNFADFVLQRMISDVHLHDPEFKSQDNYGKIRASDLNNLTEMLMSALEEPEIIKDLRAC